MKQKTIGTEQKLWIIGDSFADLPFGDECWGYILYKNFVGKYMHVSTKSSRDVQNIIDIFLRNLKNINNEDLVILFLPTLARHRLPLEFPTIDRCGTHLEDYTSKEHLDYFVGGTMYEASKQNDKNLIELEFPLNQIELSILATDKIRNQFNTGNIINLINSSNASINNTNEILKSLKSYLPFEFYIVSWTNELDDKVVDTKDIIKNKTGIWETLNDEYLKTDGVGGTMGDVHWTKNMHKLFANYVINKFTQFFEKI